MREIFDSSANYKQAQSTGIRGTGDWLGPQANYFNSTAVGEYDAQLSSIPSTSYTLSAALKQ